MAKSKKKINETIHIMTAYENTMSQKERFNPFQTGHGVHQSEKTPKRAKSKMKWKKEVAKYY